MDDQQVRRSPTEQFEDIIQQRITEAMDSLRVFGVAELAERWGVKKQRADQIASKYLPAPWRTLKMGRTWTEFQVREFEQNWVRKTGVHIAAAHGLTYSKSS